MDSKPLGPQAVGPSWLPGPGRGWWWPNFVPRGQPGVLAPLHWTLGQCRPDRSGVWVHLPDLRSGSPRGAWLGPVPAAALPERPGCRPQFTPADRWQRPSWKYLSQNRHLGIYDWAAHLSSSRVSSRLPVEKGSQKTCRSGPDSLSLPASDRTGRTPRWKEGGAGRWRLLPLRPSTPGTPEAGFVCCWSGSGRGRGSPQDSPWPPESPWGPCRASSMGTRPPRCAL